MILRKSYYKNVWQYLETLRAIDNGPELFELQRHTADPQARAYEGYLTLQEKQLWESGPEPIERGA